MLGEFFVDPSAIDQGHYETRLASPMQRGVCQLSISIYRRFFEQNGYCKGKAIRFVGFLPVEA